MKQVICILILALSWACASGGKAPVPVPPKDTLPVDAPVVTLIPAMEGLGGPGLWRQNMALADINGDGFIDFICPPVRGTTQKPNIFLGDGKGGWRKWTEARFPQLWLAYGAVDVADIDGNGLADIAIGCHNGNMNVLLQTEPGVFKEFREGLPSAVDFTTRIVRLADVTGDGRPELLAVNETLFHPDGQKSAKIRQVVLTVKDGRWTEIPILPKGENLPQTFGDALTVADFNGDGRMDFATASHLFHNKMILFLNEPEGFVGTNIAALPDSSYIFGVAAADIDGDGRPDLACTATTLDNSKETAAKDKNLTMRSRVFLLLNRPEGWVLKDIVDRPEGVSRDHFLRMAAADFDGNGRPDIVTVFTDGTLFMLLNQDGTRFARARTPGWIKFGKASWVGTADFNKDGTPDLAVSYGSEKYGGMLQAYLVKQTAAK